MRGSENQPALAQYLRTNLAVVVVHNGESQEEACRRHLADNPEANRVQVKIFHYPGSSPESPKIKMSMTAWICRDPTEPTPEPIDNQSILKPSQRILQEH